MRLIVYIDDILVQAEFREELESYIVVLMYLLECMGYIINWKKSITDSGVPRSDSGHSVHGAKIPIGQVDTMRSHANSQGNRLPLPVP